MAKFTRNKDCGDPIPPSFLACITFATKERHRQMLPQISSITQHTLDRSDSEGTQLFHLPPALDHHSQMPENSICEAGRPLTNRDVPTIIEARLIIRTHQLL